MKIKIDIDPQYEETPVITIQVKEWTDEVEAVVKMLRHHEADSNDTKSGFQPKRIVAVEEDRSILLQPSEIDYVFAEKRKVFAMAAGRALEMKLKLYELEEVLSAHGFIRFSKSVIGNLDQIDRFELSFNGNLCVYFKSGSKEYVTRKYVNGLKEQLLDGGGQRGE
ncbi:LytTR family DNA-binding domain-containing protein [Jeotgalibacillus sp. JSM ZJ347]|uniref:LytTR family DNA-binding domain-containing protein n=1 Tax=Jeotgalibacillus sp. JSM ZJ347 TaxID=3342117 RepID=UPI0035A8985E